MTDKELLEFAAKAVGIDLSGGVDENGAYEENWNPLLHDADAFRLMVELEIDVWIGCGGVTADGMRGKDSFDEEFSQNNHDSFLATRRAITRAAAEIGKAMP